MNAVLRGMKLAVVNFAAGGWYPRGQQRLFQSLLTHGFIGDFLAYKSYAELGCPRHEEVPYAFKPYAIMRAQQMGYDVVFYFDASVYLRAPLAPLLAHVEKEGCYLEACGHPVGRWCKDDALLPLHITREQSWDIPLFSAGYIGLDLRQPRSQTFLSQWHQYALERETFTGSWTNAQHECSADPRVLGHRHDMTVASVLAHRLEMPLLPLNTYAVYVALNQPKPETVLFVHSA